MNLDRFRHGMITKWVAFCLTDAGLVQGMLLASSQYFANLHYSSGDQEEGRKFEQRSFHHRGRLLRSMSDSMPQDTRDVTDTTVAKGMFLAFNEVGYNYSPPPYSSARRDICLPNLNTVLVGQHYRFDATHGRM